MLRAPVWEPGRKTLFEGSILKWLGHLRGFLIGNPTFTHFGTDAVWSMSDDV